MGVHLQRAARLKAQPRDKELVSAHINHERGAWQKGIDILYLICFLCTVWPRSQTWCIWRLLSSSIGGQQPGPYGRSCCLQAAQSRPAEGEVGCSTEEGGKEEEESCFDSKLLGFSLPSLEVSYPGPLVDVSSEQSDASQDSYSLSLIFCM